MCVTWLTFDLWANIGPLFLIFKRRVLAADENISETVAKLCVNILAEAVFLAAPPRDWHINEVLLKQCCLLISKAQRRWSNIAKQIATICMCVFTHPAWQQVCTCTRLIFSLILRIGSFNVQRSAPFSGDNDAGVFMRKSKNCMLDSSVFDIDSSFCEPSYLHWCTLF